MKHEKEERSCYNCKHFNATEKRNGTVETTCDIGTNFRVGDHICPAYKELLLDYEEQEDDHYMPTDSWRDHFFEQAIEKIEDNGNE